MGRNHIYDPGSDLLDGGPQIGFTVPGQIPEIRIFVSTDTDLLQPGASTPIYNLAVFQDGSPVVGARVTFEIVRGTGTLSSAEAFTDANGLAIVTYSAGDPGDGSSKKVRSTFHINGEKFVRDISIRVKISLHNQGTLRIG